jgi:hypothetical protein
MTATVTTQEELDAALAADEDTIYIQSSDGVWLTLTDTRSSHVEAWGSSHVEARGSSHVVARGSSHVVAWGSSHVVAWESSHVEASRHVAVHLHSQRVTLSGGVVIDLTALDLSDPQQWCDYHGVTVADGVATVYKATDDNYQTGHQFHDQPTSYAPGSTPAAADWQATPYCGNGLHFGPTPGHAQAYRRDATRYLQVGVRLEEMVPIVDSGSVAKCKAPRVVTPCVEVDRYGKPLPAPVEATAGP